MRRATALGPLPALFTLDDSPALDAERAGAKAALLAAARRAGINVLDGLVVEVAYSLPALACAIKIAQEKGPAAARLALMDADLPPGLAEAVTSAAPSEWLVARSSSPLESEGAWSGTFTSYVGLAPGELGTAIRGCWASTLTRDALKRFEHQGRDPATTGMAVLIQPAVRPTLGGVAETDSGTVRVTVAKGELAGLLQGWEGGQTAVVPATGPPSGPAVVTHGAEQITHVAELARACAQKLGDGRIEWAAVNGVCYLLQYRHLANGNRPNWSPRPKFSPLFGPAGSRAVRAVACFGGASGDDLVLPWYFATPSPSVMRGMKSLVGGGLTMDALRSAAHWLTAKAWRLPAEEAVGLASSVLARLRHELDPQALAMLSSLEPFDATTGEDLIAGVEAAATEWVRGGHLFRPSDVWRLPQPSLEHVLGGSANSQRPAPTPLSNPAPVPARNPWELFLLEAVFAGGAILHGEPASGGAGAGRLLPLEQPQSLRGSRERFVLYLPAPTPAFAPMLWGAAALISASGSSGAHLFDVARSLGVPAVAGAELGSGPETLVDGAVVAVDGDRGEVGVVGPGS